MDPEVQRATGTDCLMVSKAAGILIYRHPSSQKTITMQMLCQEYLVTSVTVWIAVYRH